MQYFIDHLRVLAAFIGMNRCLIAPSLGGGSYWIDPRLPYAGPVSDEAAELWSHLVSGDRPFRILQAAADSEWRPLMQADSLGFCYVRFDRAKDFTTYMERDPDWGPAIVRAAGKLVLAEKLGPPTRARKT